MSNLKVNDLYMLFNYIYICIIISGSFVYVQNICDKDLVYFRSLIVKLLKLRMLYNQ